MWDIERRSLECLKRCKQYYLDNTADLGNGVSKVKFQAMNKLTDECDVEAGKVAQNVGEGVGSTMQKGTAREELRNKCSRIAKTARDMEPDFDGISGIFRFTRNLNDADLIARAQGFATAAVPYEADFIAWALPATFLADLNTAISNFQASANEQTTNVDERLEAHSTLATKLGQALQIKRSLRSIVRNIFDGQPGKIAAWESASHVEKAPKTEKPKP